MLNHAKSKKTIGAGRLYFEITNALGVPIDGGGEVYLGDSPGFALTVESESLEDWTSDGPIAEKDVDVAIRVNRSFNLTTKNISFENLGLFVIGTAAQVQQAAGSVTDEEIASVTPGRFYQLGATSGNPTGVRGVTSVVVTDDDVSPVTFDLNDDYELDAATGRIRIVEGGAITQGTTLLVSYTTPANTRGQVTTDNLGAKYGRLRYVEDATFGEPKDVYAPFVQLKPTGELPFKSRDSVQQMGWEVSVQSPPAGGSALYIDGRPQAT
ncbi:hypothetical protein BGP89_11365 [Luteimonas sp. JM171]|uniref:phage tail tube protein n=1 Tax=Luteimonas sp. JM171 TaxID=1896164 RepID=UPI00085807BB|nr:hypothetical protein [Luteimonas sp. JM171]AOH36878.1 hypothetical protein BGP89_11365 [Luteimonas sp. JM171]